MAETPPAKKQKTNADGGAFSAFSALVDKHQDDYVAKLKAAVAIPGVSAEPERRPQVVEMVKWCQKECEALGATTELKELGMQNHASGQKIPLPPVLLAQFGSDPSKRTVLVYGHLDVQPAYVSDGWDTDPWSLTEKDGKLYGRGATDDKGPVLCWLWAIRTYQQLGQGLPVNVKCIFEGMEESGSIGLPKLVRSLGVPGAFLDPATIDFCCISDNYWLGSEKPCITYGLRGLAYFHLSVQCSTKDLHSGVIGGSVHEAATDLFRLMASLVDSQGRILVPGTYDKVKPMTEKEAATYETISFDIDAYKEDVGVVGVSERLLHASKAKILQHRWRFPTLSLHGVEGAFAGSGSKTVIPRKVIGKFSLRLVPDMTPERVEALVKAHLASEWAKLKSPNKMELMMDKGAAAWVTSPDGPNYLAGRRAVERTYGTPPDLTREGGSIPITLVFEEVLGKQVLLLPIGAGDDMAHSQNEKINRRNYVSGIKLLGAYMRELSTVDLNQGK